MTLFLLVLCVLPPLQAADPIRGKIVNLKGPGIWRDGRSGAQLKLNDSLDSNSFLIHVPSRTAGAWRQDLISIRIGDQKDIPIDCSREPSCAATNSFRLDWTLGTLDLSVFRKRLGDLISDAEVLARLIIAASRGPAPQVHEAALLPSDRMTLVWPMSKAASLRLRLCPADKNAVANCPKVPPFCLR